MYIFELYVTYIQRGHFFVRIYRIKNEKKDRAIYFTQISKENILYIPYLTLSTNTSDLIFSYILVNELIFWNNLFEAQITFLASWTNLLTKVTCERENFGAKINRDNRTG